MESDSKFKILYMETQMPHCQNNCYIGPLKTGKNDCALECFHHKPINSTQLRSRYRKKF
jgi:hypothetical protein